MANDLYIFHPTCELAVANGSPYYMAPAKLREFEANLASLMAFLADCNDFVVVRDAVSTEFIQYLNVAGFSPPLFIKDNLLGNIDYTNNFPGGIHRILPWGWSPVMHHLFSGLIKIANPLIASKYSEWKNIHKELFGRHSSLQILRQIVSDDSEGWMVQSSELALIVKRLDDIVLMQEPGGQLVVKSPWSSSGRGLQVLRENELNMTNIQVISGVLREQGFVLVEPWHNKLADISFQFFSNEKNEIEFLGITSFTTDKAGRFTSQNLHELSFDLSNEVKVFFNRHKESIVGKIRSKLSESSYATEYYGWLGVDTLIYRNVNGELVWHPCIEINCRFTMGAIALRLRRHLAEGSQAKFFIYRGENGLFDDFVKMMIEKSPLKLSGYLIHEGFLALTPFQSGNLFGAYLVAERT